MAARVPTPFSRKFDLLAIAARSDNFDDIRAVHTRQALEGAAGGRRTLNAAFRLNAEGGTPRLARALSGTAAGRLPARGTDERRRYDASIRAVQRWRKGQAIDPDYRARLDQVMLNQYLTTPSSSRRVARALRTIARDGMEVRFKGDWEMTGPGYESARNGKSAIADDIYPADAQTFVASCREGNWRAAGDDLEIVFWPAYFAYSGAEELVNSFDPRWTKIESLAIIPG